MGIDEFEEVATPGGSLREDAGARVAPAADDLLVTAGATVGATAGAAARHARRARPSALRAGRHAGPGRLRMVRPSVRAFGRIRIQGSLEQEWATGTRMDDHEAWLVRKWLRARERALLTLLSQHRYLTTEDIADLLFPTRSGLRHARDRLLWMRKRRLVLRATQLEPTGRGMRKLPDVYLLSQLGAAVLADFRALEGAERTALIERSKGAATQLMRMDHDLEVAAFFVLLAAASPADEGLYNWVGDDEMRARYQQRGADARPDGWGLYVAGDRELDFCLEWDRGTETIRTLGSKARAYAAYHTVKATSTTVLFVTHNRTRELAVAKEVATQVERAGADPYVKTWTANTREIEQLGVLGAIWRPAGGGERIRLRDLPSTDRSGQLQVEACLAKPGWWTMRQAAGQ